MKCRILFYLIHRQVTNDNTVESIVESFSDLIALL